MIPDKLWQVLKHEGVVAIATQGEKKPHLVNTWNSYIQVTPEHSFLVPVGSMFKTENNLNMDNHVLVTVGAREVEGFHGPGTGFLIEGTASFHKTGQKFDSVKERFPWARAALEININSATQTL